MVRFDIIWTKSIGSFMLKKIRIKNFKCYGPQGALFDLAKINFVYGGNSVGKSSFLQFLEMLLKYVDYDAKYRRDDFDRHLFKGIIKDYEGKRVGVYSKMRFSVAGDGAPVDLEFLQKENEQSSFYQLIASCNDEINVALWDKLLPKDGGQDRIVRLSAPRSKGVSVSAEDSESKDSASELESDSFLNKVALEMETDARQYLDDIFERLDIPYQCVVDADGSVAEWRIHDKDFDIDLDIDDVGTGIAGLIRLAFVLKNWKGGILAIEEPETNINENQLAALTKVLVEEALKRPNGQLIVECHSEHVVWELATLAKKGSIESIFQINDGEGRFVEGNLSVCCVNKSEDGSRISQVAISPDGDITWPEAFFPAKGKIMDELFRN